MERLVYSQAYFDTTDELDTLGNPLVALIPQAVSSIFGLFGGAGKRSGLPYGLAGITSAGNQVIQSLNQVKAGIESRQIPPRQAVSEAQRLAETLETGVYQAKKGKDAAALQSFKQQASRLLQEIQALAAASVPANASSGGGGSTSGSPESGISSTTLLLIGGGIAAILLLRS